MLTTGIEEIQTFLLAPLVSGGYKVTKRLVSRTKSTAFRSKLISLMQSEAVIVHIGRKCLVPVRVFECHTTCKSERWLIGYQRRAFIEESVDT